MRFNDCFFAIVCLRFVDEKLVHVIYNLHGFGQVKFTVYRKFYTVVSPWCETLNLIATFSFDNWNGIPVIEAEKCMETLYAGISVQSDERFERN